MPKLHISTNKKGKQIIKIILDDKGKEMSAPKETIADDSLDGKEVEVTRHDGLIQKIICEGKILYEKENTNPKSQNSTVNPLHSNISETMLIHHTDQIHKPAKAPYNFIPLNHKVIESQPPPDFNTYHENRHTGWIDLHIKTQSPLYIRDTVNETELNDNKKSNEMSSFYSPSGKIQIPGSSLRGMIRTIVEMVSYSKFGFFEDKLLFYRGLADQSNLRQDYQKRMSSFDRSQKKTQYKMSAGYLHKQGINYLITPATGFNQITKDQARSKIEAQGLSYQVFNYYSLSSNECIVVSGDMKNKKHDWIIYAPQKDKQILVPDIDIHCYHNDFNRSDNVPNLVEHAKHNDIPCFYVQWIDSLGRNRISFGHTGMFRLAYEKSIGDHIPHYLKDPATIDIADAIFGKQDESNNCFEDGVFEDSVFEEYTSFPGRVFFEDAMLCEGQSNVLAKPGSPKILSSPKPTTFQHYLVQSSDDIKKLNHYNTNASIRGNKAYWHQSGDHWEQTDKDAINKNASQYTTIQPVKKGTQFKGKIRFENLTDIELGALLFSIQLPEGCFHKLGMAKPLGLGSIHIRPELFISDRQKRYSDLFYEWQTNDMKQNPCDFYKEHFEKYILAQLDITHLNSLWETERLQVLKIMLDFQRGLSMEETGQTEYMAIIPQTGVNEFKNRLILQNPAVADI